MWHTHEMSSTTSHRPAEPGSLNAEALADLVVYQQFIRGRDKALHQLYGKRLPRSILRDELLIIVIIEFGRGKTHQISYYQRCLHELGSSTTIRSELDRLAGLELLILQLGVSDRRTAEVVPAQRLVDWYSNQMPRLRKEVRRFLADWV